VFVLNAAKKTITLQKRASKFIRTRVCLSYLSVHSDFEECQQTVERLDRRGKVMRSQIKNRQTVDKYKNAAPQFSHSAATEEDDEENNVFQLENGENGEKHGNGMGVRKWQGDASAAIGRKIEERKVKSNGKSTHHKLGGEELAEHTEIAV
jgi:hypothetical protein